MPFTDPSATQTWIHAQAAETAQELGCELVEVNLGRSGGRNRVEIVIDRPGGVGIEDCARLSRSLSARLEAADPLENAYILEVGSPGLTRPLHTPGDYRRFRGRLARIVLRKTVSGRDFLRGNIVSVSADDTTLTIADDKLQRAVEVALADIASGRLDFDQNDGPSQAAGGTRS